MEPFAIFPLILSLAWQTWLVCNVQIGTLPLWMMWAKCLTELWLLTETLVLREHSQMRLRLGKQETPSVALLPQHEWSHFAQCPSDFILPQLQSWISLLRFKPQKIQEFSEERLTFHCSKALLVLSACPVHMPTKSFHSSFFLFGQIRSFVWNNLTHTFFSTAWHNILSKHEQIKLVKDIFAFPSENFSRFQSTTKGTRISVWGSHAPLCVI